MLRRVIGKSPNTHEEKVCIYMPNSRSESLANAFRSYLGVAVIELLDTASFLTPRRCYSPLSQKLETHFPELRSSFDERSRNVQCQRSAEIVGEERPLLRYLPSW
jgi:hypothetical protein